MLPPLYVSFLNNGIRAAWFPSLVFVVHVILSRGFDAYTVMAWIDIPMHVLGGIAITWFYAKTFHHLEQRLFARSDEGYSIYLLFLFALTGMTTGVWEFAEFLADHFFDAGAQKSLPDTMLDMALGFAGALLFLLPCSLSRISARRHSASRASGKNPADQRRS